jgi:hypothetical protein
MKRLRLLGAILIGVVILTSSALHAATITLSPVVDQTFRDFDLDGYFESPHPESGNPLSETLRFKRTAGYVETRAALEFDISNIPTEAVIQSAEFSFTVVGCEGDHTLEFHGYTGNGTIESDDMNVENIIWGPTTIPSAITYTIDAASSVISAVQAGYVGFSGRMASCPPNNCGGLQIASKESPTRPDDRPVLTIQYTSSEVPIPPALWLFGSGLLGLIGMARRKA